jgi:Glu-tRNA(Gln) amidotransferase subunit E-like FAD-binding protein
MSEFVSEIELSARLGHKIVIAGLAEAGKTATKRIFFLKHQTTDVDKLPATVNYERMSVVIKDVPITIVDLGGQRVFLKRFLSTFSPFIFSNVKAFIFIIDVANRATRNNSVEYFANCIEKLKNFSPKANFTVLLHKNDLVRHWPNYESIHGQLKEQFQLVSPQKLAFFRSTIYKPETVINAFGRIIELTLPDLAESEFVDGRRIDQIEEFAEKFITHGDVPSKEATEPISPTPISSSQPSQINNLQTLMKAGLSGEVTGINEVDPLTNLQESMKAGLDKTTSEVTEVTEVTSSESPLAKLQESMKVALESSDPEVVETLDQQTPLAKLQESMKAALESSDPEVIETLDQQNPLTKLQESMKAALESSDPEVIETLDQQTPLTKLQESMKESLLTEKSEQSEIVSSAPISSVTNGEPSIIVEQEKPNYFQAALNELKSPVVKPTSEQDEIKTLTQETQVVKTQEPIEPETKTVESKDDIDELRITHLVNFYGLDPGDSSEIVKYGYDDVFGLAVTSGFPLDLALKVFLNYIPLIRSQPKIDIKFLDKEKLLNIFMAYSKNVITDEELFDFLITITEQPSLSIAEISQEIKKLDKSRYETIITHIKGESKYIEGISDTDKKISNKQERINKIMFINSSLQIDDAVKLVESGYDDFYEIAISAGVPFKDVLDVILNKIPFIKSKGLNTERLDKQRILTIIKHYSKDRLSEQGLFNSLIMSIIKPKLSAEEILEQYQTKQISEEDTIVEPKETQIKPSEPLTEEPLERREPLSDTDVSYEKEKQQRINYLLKITTDLQIEDAIKLVEIGFDKVFSIAISSGLPLVAILNVLVKQIPAIKAEGFNIQHLTQKRLLEIFIAYSRGYLKEDDIYDCLTIAIIKPYLSIAEIVKEFLTKAKVRAVKMKEIERIEKEIEPIPKLEDYGLKGEIAEGNCLLTFYFKGQPVNKAMVSPTISIEDIIYMMKFEIDVEFKGGPITQNFIGRGVQDFIKKTYRKAQR